MLPAESEQITDLLNRWSASTDDDPEEVFRLVYGELKRIASSYLRRESPGHLHQTTSIVHEAYMRLTTAKGLRWKSREHFFAFTARLMRRVLVDLARERGRACRGAGVVTLELGELGDSGAVLSEDVLEIDEALSDLARIDAQKVQIVELRFFVGLSIEETARVLGVSKSTVDRQWRLAKLWLFERLGGA